MNTIDSRKYDTVLKGCDIEFYTTIESLHINNKYMFRLVPDFQMDIAETNDELRIKVESLVKMIRK